MAALPQMTVPDLEGSFRTFGEYGPLYEVLRYAGSSPEGKPLVEIRVLDTGEILSYRLDRLLADPVAQ